MRPRPQTSARNSLCRGVTVTLRRPVGMPVADWHRALRIGTAAAWHQPTCIVRGIWTYMATANVAILTMNIEQPADLTAVSWGVYPTRAFERLWAIVQRALDTPAPTR